ncbi:MAG: class II fumarate hydratase [Desulfobacterales bacterium]|nr:class II fumarate hydratase [Desulfobacterales bacterium]
MEKRTETDSLGPVEVPKEAYFGASTQRAVDNFPVSGLQLPASFLETLALIKQMAARVNRELGLLDESAAGAIETACGEIIDGKLADQFPVDVFQTGSGTSTNMNMNEVIASRANEILTGKKGGRSPVHPNDHVNLGQSSNDVIPTALHVSGVVAVKDHLVPVLEQLAMALWEKSLAFEDIPKIGRTHLQDAVPIKLGDEFAGYTYQVQKGVARATNITHELTELPLGGTAVGNGLNTHPEFAQKVIAHLAEHTGFPFREARSHFEAQGARDAAVAASGLLKTIAVSLAKIANDIRWLGSGPGSGLGEIRLPAIQPGSSIMPGKVNPVIPEAVIQAAVQVIGNDTVVTLAGKGGHFELNAMLPVMIHNLHQSIRLLTGAADIFTQRCIRGIEADTEKCFGTIVNSLALATYLVPDLGYDKSAEIAHRAHAEGKTVEAVVREEGALPEDRIKALFDQFRSQ